MPHIYHNTEYNDIINWSISHEFQNVQHIQKCLAGAITENVTNRSKFKHSFFILLE